MLTMLSMILSEPMEPTRDNKAGYCFSAQAMDSFLWRA